MVTLTDGVIPALVGLEVGLELFHRGITVLTGNDFLSIEDDSFIPLNFDISNFLLPLELISKLLRVQFFLHNFKT